MTAEGLFRAALDGLRGIAEEANDEVAKSQSSSVAVAPPIMYPSPIHPYSKAATLRGYSELLMQWEKREAEGDIVTRQAETVSNPSFWGRVCSSGPSAVLVRERFGDFKIRVTLCTRAQSSS